MKVVTDLKLIEKAGILNEDVNWRFRSFLKSINDGIVDRKVRKIYEEIRKQIDCTQCGNCCTQLQPLVKEEEIRKLAEETGIEPGKFVEKFLEYDLDENEYRFEKTPCPFLYNQKCLVYESRPEDCKSYPHIEGKDFSSKLINVVLNYSICPIVYNVYERLKAMYNFK